MDLLKLMLAVFITTISIYLLIDEEEIKQNTEEQTPTKQSIEVIKREFSQFEYDGCEYVYIKNQRETTITHKGNCKQCIERENQPRYGY